MINDGVQFAFVYSFFILAEKKVHKGFKMSDIDQLILVLIFRFGVVFRVYKI